MAQYHSSRAVIRDVTKMTKEAAAEALGEWHFREDKHGDWRGFHEDGRRTALKRGGHGYTGLQFAQNDVLNGRILCPEWPNCQHYSNGQLSESIEACVIAGRELRDRQASGLRGGQRREFRGRKEYHEV